MHINKRFLRSTAVLAGALLLGACVVKPQPSPEELQARQAHLDKVQKAKARFEELCKTAGITVNRRVTGVKGIRLERVPAQSNWKDWTDPMWPEAALSGGVGGGAFLERLIKRRSTDSKTGKLNGSVTNIQVGSVPGYEYVDVKQVDGTWRRFHLVVDGGGRVVVVSKDVSESELSPYAVSYEVPVDSKDRLHWVAGVTIDVVDVRTGERLGDIRRYVWDRGMGDSAGGRSAWPIASGNDVCPSMSGYDTFGHFMVLINSIITPGGE